MIRRCVGASIRYSEGVRGDFERQHCIPVLWEVIIIRFPYVILPDGQQACVCKARWQACTIRLYRTVAQLFECFNVQARRTNILLLPFRPILTIFKVINDRFWSSKGYHVSSSCVQELLPSVVRAFSDLPCGCGSRRTYSPEAK